MKHVIIAALKLYRLVISPLYGQTCRYYPTCSAYALGSVERHGAMRGSWLMLRRLARCHPWCAGGVDLVPTLDTYRWWGVADGADGEDRPGQADDSRAAPVTNPASNDARHVLRGV